MPTSHTQSKLALLQTATALGLALFLAPDRLAAGEPHEFVLVRDLETAPNHLAFDGRIFEAELGTLAYAHRTLWRIEGPAVAPTPLIRNIWQPDDVQALGGGIFAAPGTAPETGELALWITDGGPARKLAPPGFPGQPPYFGPTLALHDGAVYTKTVGIFSPDGLWRLEEGADPAWLGPGGAFSTSGDPTQPASCAGVVPTPTGFLHCRGDDPGPTLWIHDGISETEIAGIKGGDLDLWTEYGNAVYARAGWSHDQLLRTDGTAAGTSVVDEIAGRPFVLGGSLVWLRGQSPGQHVVRITDGVSPPTTLAAIGGANSVGSLGIAANRLYLGVQTLSPGPICHLLAVAPNGTTSTINSEGRCASSRVVNAPRLGGGLVLLAAPQGVAPSLFAVSTSDVTPVATPTGAWPGSYPVLTPQAGDPFVPWLDPAGRSRIATVGPAGVEPGDELLLAGTAGSRAEVLGQFLGETLILADTALEGPTLWRSRGTPESTHVLDPKVTSRCREPHTARPQLVAPDTIVDCVGTDGRARAWIFADLANFQEVELDFAAMWGATEVVRLPGLLLHPFANGVLARSLDNESAVVVLDDCPYPDFETVSSRVLVACTTGKVYSTDGTTAGTTLLLDPHALWAPVLVPVGTLAAIYYENRDGTWLSDATPEGTRSLAGVEGVAAAPVDATWTCGWSASGTILRVGLFDDEVVPLAEAMSHSSIRPTTKNGGAQVHSLSVLADQAVELWRCDGTQSGTGYLTQSPWSWSFRDRGLVTFEGAVWGHEAWLGHERIVRVSLADGSTESVVDRPIPPGDERMAGSNGPADMPLRVSSGQLWTTLGDAEHGREPFVLRLHAALFADGFESGDTSQWSSIADLGLP